MKDGSHWNGMEEFTLLQAACLWVGIWPLNSRDDLQCSPEATARYQMLTRAIETGKFEAFHPNPAPRTIKLAAQGQHAPDMLVSRDDLKAFATSIGERPLFLFSASARVQSTSAGEIACMKWLCELMRRSDAPDHAKGHYEKEAKQRFNVSERGFDRVWHYAVQETGACKWSASGRKPGSRNQRGKSTRQ